MPATAPRQATSRTLRVAWLSLDPGDSDPHRFLTHLVAAVRAAAPAPDPGIGAEVLGLLDADPALRSDDALVSLVNDLDAMPGRTVVCLDDLHVVDAAPVHDAVAFLVDNLPPQVTLAVTTRADPPLPLPRLRARGELVEVRAADLRFTEDEAGHFLNDVMGLDLAERQVAALETRTEGWAAGLQLAALSAGDGGDRFVEEFAGSQRFVLDYLLEEVLDAQPDERPLLPPRHLRPRRADRRPLRRADRPHRRPTHLGGARAGQPLRHRRSTTTGAGGATTTSSRMPCAPGSARRTRRGWAGCTGSRPGGTRARGGSLDAVPHALAGDDAELAADLVELALPGLRRRREDRMMRGWLRALPEGPARRRPLLATGIAWVRLTEGDLPGVDSWLDAAEAGLAAGPAAGPVAVAAAGEWPAVLAEAVREREEEVAGLPAMVAVYRASTAQARGDLAGTVAHARRALDLAGPGRPLPARRGRRVPRAGGLGGGRPRHRRRHLRCGGRRPARGRQRHRRARLHGGARRDVDGARPARRGAPAARARTRGGGRFTRRGVDGGR